MMSDDHAMCPNPWHGSAPARATISCPECAPRGLTDSASVDQDPQHDSGRRAGRWSAAGHHGRFTVTDSTGELIAVDKGTDAEAWWTSSRTAGMAAGQLNRGETPSRLVLVRATPKNEPTEDTYWGGPLPEATVTPNEPTDRCYPHGPTVRQLADQPPHKIPGTEIEAPPIGDAVVHVWGGFAGLAIELGGYQDVELVDPYTGRRLWVPLPDRLRYAGPLAWYRYALDVAERSDLLRPAAIARLDRTTRAAHHDAQLRRQAENPTAHGQRYTSGQDPHPEQ